MGYRDPSPNAHVDEMTALLTTTHDPQLLDTRVGLQWPTSSPLSWSDLAIERPRHRQLPTPPSHRQSVLAPGGLPRQHAFQATMNHQVYSSIPLYEAGPLVKGIEVGASFWVWQWEPGSRDAR